MELYEKIQILRKIRGFTQQELADQLYMSRQAVQKWETGVTSPDISKLRQLAQIFNITTDQLLDPDIDQDTLVQHSLNVKEPQSKVAQKQTYLTQRSAVDWLIIIPFILGVGILIFMFYVIGAIILLIIFASAIASVLYGIYAFINFFFILSGPISHPLLSIGLSVLGFGLYYPILRLTIWMSDRYKVYAVKLYEWLKRQRMLRGLWHHE